jgi:hypothetical protein
MNDKINELNDVLENSSEDSSPRKVFEFKSYGRESMSNIPPIKSNSSKHGESKKKTDKRRAKNKVAKKSRKKNR